MLGHVPDQFFLPALFGDVDGNTQDGCLFAFRVLIADFSGLEPARAAVGSGSCFGRYEQFFSCLKYFFVFVVEAGCFLGCCAVILVGLADHCIRLGIEQFGKQAVCQDKLSPRIFGVDISRHSIDDQAQVV